MCLLQRSAIGRSFGVIKAAVTTLSLVISVTPPAAINHGFFKEPRGPKVSLHGSIVALLVLLKLIQLSVHTDSLRVASHA